MKINQYFVHDAEVLEDGVLRVGWCGSEEYALTTGVYEIAPDNPEYKFWLWLKERHKRRWYQLGPIAGLNPDAVARHRQEYERLGRQTTHLMNEPKQPPKNTGIFPDAQWICVFLICFTGYLFATKPAPNLAQLIFRGSLFLAGIVGLIIIRVRKKKS